MTVTMTLSALKLGNDGAAMQDFGNNSVGFHVAVSLNKGTPI